MLDLLILTLLFLPSFIADVKSELRTYPERVLYFEPEIEEQLVEFKDDNGTVMEAFVAFPKTGSEKPLPAVVIYPTFAGRTDFEDRHARELAKLGYVGVVADVYGKEVKGKLVSDNFMLMNFLLEERETILLPRLLLALDWTISQPNIDRNRIVAIGFCFGGLMALDLARWGAPLRGVFVFHATLTGTNGTSNSTISLPIEAHHGDQDPFTNANQVDGFLEEMRSRAEDWMFIRHSGAEHAFTMPEVDDMNIPGASYNEQATRRSWKSLIRFLKDHNE